MVYYITVHSSIGPLNVFPLWQMSLIEAIRIILILHLLIPLTIYFRDKTWSMDLGTIQASSANEYYRISACLGTISKEFEIKKNLLSKTTAVLEIALVQKSDISLVKAVAACITRNAKFITIWISQISSRFSMLQFTMQLRHEVILVRLTNICFIIVFAIILIMIFDNDCSRDWTLTLTKSFCRAERHSIP